MTSVEIDTATKSIHTPEAQRDTPEYLDYWRDFAAENPDIKERCLVNYNWQILHRDEILNPPSYRRPEKIAASAWYYYRTLGQHNELAGAEEDLTTLYQIFDQYGQFGGERVNWELEAASVLVDLSRLPGTHTEKRNEYRLQAHNRLYKIIHNHHIGWDDPAKFTAAMLAEDLEFDALFEQFQEIEKLPKHGKEYKAHSDDLEHKYYLMLKRSIHHYEEALGAYDTMPRDEESARNRKSSMEGGLMEWQYLISKRLQIYEEQTYDSQRIYHATLRQDEATDKYSGRPGMASDNFDLVTEMYAEGLHLRQPIQLKKSSVEKEYRKPIITQVFKSKSHFIHFIHGSKIYERALRNVENKKDRHFIDWFRSTFAEV